jgi:radical SAM protein with 4Fe4S-binding SPASM domain
LTGGEPLLRPDFIDIFTYAKKKGLLVTLLTNGTLLTPAIADFFMKYSPKTIDLSLYGATRETYEKITGVPGSYEKCINGIEMLVQRRIPLKLKSVVLTVNKHEIGQIQEYAHKLGLPFRFDPNIMPRLDHGGEPIDYRLSPEETYELEQQFRESREAVGDFYRKFAGPRRSDLSYICKGGDYSFFVDSYGRLSVCISSRTPNYDLRHGSFAEAFYDFIPQVKARKARPNSKCQKCELIAVCGRCPATAELETGDPDAEVEWLCRLAHLKASKYLIKTK